jgi:histidinol-phosphate/aromatic aminotransferase/cobyric acid decarboxylase-like protein
VLFAWAYQLGRNLAEATRPRRFWFETSEFPGTLRVSAGTEAETTAFLAGLREVLGEA